MIFKDHKQRVVREVKSRRLQKNLSLRKLAKLTGVSFATLSRIERGQGVPDDNTIVQLSQWLGEDFELAEHLNVLEAHLNVTEDIDAKTIESLSRIIRLLKDKLGWEK